MEFNARFECIVCAACGYTSEIIQFAMLLLRCCCGRMFETLLQR
jgi:hypothetical protein